MRLSKAAYYADFAIYAALLAVLLAIAALGPSWTQRLHWAAACVAGAVGWTLIEYLLHCFVLHGDSMLATAFAPMHAVHHESPRAYVGTPTWITLGVFWLAVPQPGNFGVTIAFWDYFFGTVIDEQRPVMRRRPVTER